jgi:ATP-dependent Clp protease ATP-binding subunit ClpA
VKELNDLLLDKNITITFSDETINHVIEKGYDNKLGARPMARTISDLVKVPLSKKILFDKLDNCNIKVTYDTAIGFDIEPKSYAIYQTNKLIDENGYIIIDSIKSNC